MRLGNLGAKRRSIPRVIAMAFGSGIFSGDRLGTESSQMVCLHLMLERVFFDPQIVARPITEDARSSTVVPG
jgi:hypothetical protein